MRGVSLILDLVESHILNFSDLDGVPLDGPDAKPVKPSWSFAGDSRTVFGRVEHAEVAAAFEQGMQ